MAENDRHLFEEILDIAVYVPVGLALRALEEVPALAAQGRARVGQQVENARVLGRFTVGIAKARGLKGLHFGPRSEEEATTTEDSVAPEPEGSSTSLFDGATAAPEAWRVEVPLAIPDYDALSASQVVPRLSGLTRDELDAVSRYESATRRRRTILGRVSQLQREPGESSR